MAKEQRIPTFLYLCNRKRFFYTAKKKEMEGGEKIREKK